MRSSTSTCWKDSDERGENEMFNAKLELNRGRFLRMSIVPKHSDPSGKKYFEDI